MWDLSFSDWFISLSIILSRSSMLLQMTVFLFSSLKGQVVNSLDFAGHMVSVVTTQLSHCIVKAA